MAEVCQHFFTFIDFLAYGPLIADVFETHSFAFLAVPDI